MPLPRRIGTIFLLENRRLREKLKEWKENSKSSSPATSGGISLALLAISRRPLGLLPQVRQESLAPRGHVPGCLDEILGRRRLGPRLSDVSLPLLAAQRCEEDVRPRRASSLTTSV